MEGVEDAHRDSGEADENHVRHHDLEQVEHGGDFRAGDRCGSRKKNDGGGNQRQHNGENGEHAVDKRPRSSVALFFAGFNQYGNECGGESALPEETAK